MFAVAPYIVDIAVIAGYLFYRKKALFWLSFVAFVDVILNYFAMVVWLFDKNAAIDFIIIGLAGYVWLPVVIAIAAFVIWAYSNQEIVLKLYKKFRK
jgi:hypothetical protein